MQRMWCLRKGNLIVFFPYADGNNQAARRFRKNDSRFKGGRITDVLQAYPSKITFGKVYQEGEQE